MDNDGDLDLAVANWGTAAFWYENDGAGRFTRQSLTMGHHFASSLAWGDYDGDGDLDVVIGNWPNAPGPEEANVLLRNDGPTGNWLSVRLVGEAPNTSAIGAVVRVTATIGGRRVTQRRDVTAHTSWRSQDALDVHIGLGDAAQADRVEVTWPSGQAETWENIEAGQRVALRQGTPTPSH